MTKEQIMVMNFHVAFGILINYKPTLIDPKTAQLRIDLIKEELKEFEEAIAKGDLVEIADALADLKYVIEGAAVSFGIDLDPVFHEVHRSNMSKVGGHRREDGKWIKPDTYSSPKIASILAKQGLSFINNPLVYTKHMLNKLTNRRIK